MTNPKDEVVHVLKMNGCDQFYQRVQSTSARSYTRYTAKKIGIASVNEVKGVVQDYRFWRFLRQHAPRPSAVAQHFD